MNGLRKFFIEVKKPSANIKGNVSPACQLKRHAWSAKLPLSVLSGFEQIALVEGA